MTVKLILLNFYFFQFILRVFIIIFFLRILILAISLRHLFDVVVAVFFYICLLAVINCIAKWHYERVNDTII